MPRHLTPQAGKGDIGVGDPSTVQSKIMTDISLGAVNFELQIQTTP